MDLELTLELGWAKGVDLETWVSTWGRRDVDWILKIVWIPWGEGLEWILGGSRVGLQMWVDLVGCNIIAWHC